MDMGQGCTRIYPKTYSLVLSFFLLLINCIIQMKPFSYKLLISYAFIHVSSCCSVSVLGMCVYICVYVCMCVCVYVCMCVCVYMCIWEYESIRVELSWVWEYWEYEHKYVLAPKYSCMQMVLSFPFSSLAFPCFYFSWCNCRCLFSFGKYQLNSSLVKV